MRKKAKPFFYALLGQELSSTTYISPSTDSLFYNLTDQYVRVEFPLVITHSVNNGGILGDPTLLEIDASNTTSATILLYVDPWAANFLDLSSLVTATDLTIDMGIDLPSIDLPALTSADNILIQIGPNSSSSNILASIDLSSLTNCAYLEIGVDGSIGGDGADDLATVDLLGFTSGSNDYIAIGGNGSNIVTPDFEGTEILMPSNGVSDGLTLSFSGNNMGKEKMSALLIALEQWTGTGGTIVLDDNFITDRANLTVAGTAAYNSIESGAASSVWSGGISGLV